MGRRCYVIANPTSGSYSHGKIERITTFLSRSGLDPVLLLTTNHLDATLFASRICASEEDPLIAVAGGDGTVNGVVNGLAPGAATLAVLPVGTSNVLARELEIRGLDDALKRLAAGKYRNLPVGEAACGGHRKYFLLMAGVGFDGEVVEGVRLSEKRSFGKGAYFLSALRELASWDHGSLQVAGNGSTKSCHSVIVCNAAKYGGNFRLAAAADLFTPGFQVVCIHGGPFTYVKLALQLFLKQVPGGPCVTTITATEVEVVGNKAIQIDGDAFGRGPVNIRSIPDFVRLIV